MIKYIRSSFLDQIYSCCMYSSGNRQGADCRLGHLNRSQKQYIAEDFKIRKPHIFNINIILITTTWSQGRMNKVRLTNSQLLQESRLSFEHPGSFSWSAAKTFYQAPYGQYNRLHTRSESSAPLNPPPNVQNNQIIGNNTLFPATHFHGASGGNLNIDVTKRSFYSAAAAPTTMSRIHPY